MVQFGRACLEVDYASMHVQIVVNIWILVMAVLILALKVFTFSLLCLTSINSPLFLSWDPSYPESRVLLNVGSWTKCEMVRPRAPYVW